MNRYTLIATLAFGSILLHGCRQADIDIAEVETDNTTSEILTTAKPLNNTLPDVIRVRFSREMGEHIEAELKKNTLRSTGSEIDLFLDEIDAKSLERVFPHAGKYEERTRREGLHLWYDIKLYPQEDRTKAVTVRNRAMSLAEEFGGIELAEPVYVGTLPDIIPVVFEGPVSTLRSGGTLPTNDPLLPMQWHYNNDGTFVRAEKGADANIFTAWDIEMGKRKILVAVVDGGIDTAHEDLKDNLYVNEVELNGTTGKDDDNNGLVDDIHGYNFVLDQGTIVAHNHGTHVAGTVAARNNNGIGVAGVAGGNGSADSGIRMISCQTFVPDGGSTKSGGFEKAIKAGADMGAVISQNSWGQPNQTQLPASYKVAIDYFIKYAGCDNNGDQLPDSPMKGGVVIFAAGNEGYDYPAALASYEEVIAVSAMAPDFKASYFTTRGDWVDVMAPGGDMFYNNGKVLSTLPGNKYGYMQGTSMACPHVSGIAALILSKYGGKGFTNEDLKRRITTSLKANDINAINPQYSGRLGAGYIDAALALAAEPSAEELANNQAPETVRWAEAVVTQVGMTISWYVASDPEDGKAFGYYLYGEANSFTEKDLPNLGFSKVLDQGPQVGDQIKRSFTKLSADTEYYFAIIPFDKWGNRGKVSFKTVRTLNNNAPTITMPQVDPIRISGSEVYEIIIPVTDADGHNWIWKIVGQTYGAIVEKIDEGLKVQLRARATVGQHKLVLQVTDTLGASNELELPFEIIRNHAPLLTTNFGRLYLPLNSSEEINLGIYFSDTDGQTLTYTVRNIGKVTCEATIDGSKLSVKAISLGLSAFEIVATDTKGASTKAILEVEATNDQIIQLLYPSPVKDTLNMRVLPKYKTLDITVFSQNGAQLLKQTVSVGSTSVASIDVSKLPAGTFILQAESQGKSVRKTFIKR